MKPGPTPERARPLLILGRAPNASDLALRRILHAKKPDQALIVIDYQGAVAPRLTERNKGNLHRKPLLWCDLGNRRRPVSLFRFRRSVGMKTALRAFLLSAAQLLPSRIGQRTIEIAVDLAHRLADNGTMGLAALVRSLCRPEIAQISRGLPNENEEIDLLVELIDWALRFPSVWALSEGNNPIDLGSTLKSGGTAWIEMPSHHFEEMEHRLVSRMIESMLLEALMSLRDIESSKTAPPPIILYGFPGMAPLPVAFAGDLTAKQIGLFRFDESYPLPAAARPWLDISADCWITGRVGALSATSRTDWLTENERLRLSKLDPDEVWVRSGVDRKAVTMLVRSVAKDDPLAPGYRKQALKRLRLTPVKQFSTAMPKVEPQQLTDPGLYRSICKKESLYAAWLRVRVHNADSHGSDGITIEQFGATLDAQLELLADELTRQRYESRPLRTVRIPKADGDYRVLKIACVRDRVVHAAFLRLVEPLFESRFSSSSFAYRPGRNAHQAVGAARSAIRSGRQWAVTADIRKCFDTIDHEILLRLVGDVMTDRLMIRLLRHWITADVIDFLDIVPSELGVPQGAAISPLLANIYLDPLDKEFERAGMKFVRYADDYLVLCRTEPDAQAALRLMSEFLQNDLHMTLKPAKTMYCRVDQGVAFLGFEIGIGDEVRIPSGKVARAISVVRDHVTTLASPLVATRDKWQATTKMNALIRGFRNYFLIDNAPLIRGQLSEMDDSLEAVAAEKLEADTGPAFVWACRERFSENSKDWEANAAASALTGAYPTEGAREPPAPTGLFEHPGSKDATAEGRDTAHPRRLPAPISAIQEHSEEIAEANATVVVDGRLHVMESGCYVTISGEDLLVRRKKREVFRTPIGNLATVYLEGKGIALSADLTMHLCERDIPVIFAPLIGVPSAVAQPVQTMRSNVRQQQVLRRDDPLIIRVGFGMLAAKVANQASLLKYFARYRKNRDLVSYQALTRTADEVRQIAATLDGLDSSGAAARSVGMGYEGRAASKYWSSLATLMPKHLSFPSRQMRYATDAVNSAVNYVYGMLYGEVWRSVVRCGLDPYFGIIHGSGRDQGSLVFDVIEEYRAPFADRVVVGMLGRGFELELDGEGRLRARCRHKLVGAFHKQWHRELPWRGRMRRPSNILDEQLASLRNTFLGNDDYRPFRFRW